MKLRMFCSLFVALVLTSCTGKWERLEVSEESILFDEVPSQVRVNVNHEFYAMDYVEYEGADVVVQENGPVENLDGKHFAIVVEDEHTIAVKAFENNSGKECYGSVSLRGTKHIEGTVINFRQKLK